MIDNIIIPNREQSILSCGGAIGQAMVVIGRAIYFSLKYLIQYSGNKNPLAGW